MVLNNEQELKDLLGEGVVVLDFYAPWCNPCKMLSPVIDDLEKEMTDVKFVKIDTDELTELALEYNVVTLPTIKIFKDNQEVETLNGFLPKALLQAKINSHK